MKNLFTTYRRRTILMIVVVICLTTAATWTIAKSTGGLIQNKLSTKQVFQTTLTDTGSKWSKAILTVSNMTCGGCIGTIKKSLATLPGIGEVKVDLASSTAEVLYDATTLSNPQDIPDAINDSGYPANIQKLVPSRQLEQKQIEAADKAKTHIAGVGLIDISRQDFEIELGHIRARYEQIYGADMFSTPQGKQLFQRIKSQIALRLIDEATKMQEVLRAGHTLADDKIENAMSDYIKEKKTTLAQFEHDLETNGYTFDYFKRKFSQRMLLQDYLDEKILSGSTDTDDRQRRYENWLSNARALAKVEYYDKSLGALVQTGNGCSGAGGSGCGGSCSVSP